jgi:hypothetical protein
MVRVHEYLDGRLATFHGHIGWPIMIPRGSCATHQTGWLSRFGSRPVDLWTTLRVAHNPTGPPQTTTEAVN